MASPIRVTVSRTAASKARAQKRKANQARAKAKRAQQQAQGQRGRAQQRAQGQAQRQRAAKIAKAAGRAGARAAVPRPITAAVRAGRAAGMDGIEVLDKLRADPQFEETLIVMLTSHGDGEIVKQALSRKANDYILKDDMGNMAGRLKKYQD